VVTWQIDNSLYDKDGTERQFKGFKVGEISIVSPSFMGTIPRWLF